MRYLLFFLVFLLVPFKGWTNIYLADPDTGTLASIFYTDGVKPFINARLEDGELFFEIASSSLNQPMLLVNHLDGSELVYKNVMWRLHDDQLVLESCGRIKSLAGDVIPVGKTKTSQNTIIGFFPILKEKSKQDVLSINVTKLFIGVPLTTWDNQSDKKKSEQHSKIYEIKKLTDEIVIRTLQVFTNPDETWSELVDYSMYLLPVPMTPRAFDHRMGFAGEVQSSSNTINYKPETPAANISRWRLEKKHKGKAISEPVKPITFILPLEIPEKWRPYVKAGILEWLPAFEAAGFKNALVVKEASDEDSTIAFNSVNHSMVRWGNKRNVRGYELTQGATVSNIIDYRSGEILKSDLFIGVSYLSLMDGYFIRCATLDKRALQYPFPDELTGSLIQWVVAHEAGHAFGLRDGNYGEYAYPFERMRNIKWLKEMGHTPSVMTYGRHNNLPQPKDSIPPNLLIQKVGPTDVYSIRWAYTPFEDNSKVQETNALEAIVREQDSIPWYRFNLSQYEIIGPGSTNEVVETNNPIQSTELAVSNMRNVIKLLSVVNSNQKDINLVERLYGEILNYWFNQMRAVLSLIGGYEIQYKSGSQSGNVYTPLPKEVQYEALKFIIKNVFDPPHWLIHPEVFNHTKYSTFPDQLIQYQTIILKELISQRRMKRLSIMESSTTYRGISINMIKDLETDLFKELADKEIEIDARKSEIQRIYVDALIQVISQKSGQLNAIGNISYDNQSKGLFMKSLLLLKKKIEENIENCIDDATYGHLKLVLLQLQEIE